MEDRFLLLGTASIPIFVLLWSHLATMGQVPLTLFKFLQLLNLPYCSCLITVRSHCEVCVCVFRSVMLTSGREAFTPKELQDTDNYSKNQENLYENCFGREEYNFRVGFVYLNITRDSGLNVLG